MMRVILDSGCDCVQNPRVKLVVGEDIDPHDLQEFEPAHDFDAETEAHGLGTAVWCHQLVDDENFQRVLPTLHDNGE